MTSRLKKAGALQISSIGFLIDAHGLYMFDGANTYEYADRRKGFHPDWNSYIFNYKREK